MFRFRFKFLADSYLLLFSFFSGNDRGSVIFLVALSCISFLFILQLWNNRKQKLYRSVSDRHKTAFFPAGCRVALRAYGLQCMAVWDTDLFLVFQPGNGSYLFYIGKGTLGTASVFAFPSSSGDILSHGLVRSFQMVF